VILRQTFVHLALGIAVGVVLALAATRGVSTLLYGLQPNDPLPFVGSSALHMGVSLLASLVPAHRASRFDPWLL
jgi:ABC-type lipoprotein release transport system permease subunit